MGNLYWAQFHSVIFGDIRDLCIWSRMFPRIFKPDSEESQVGIGTILGPGLLTARRASIIGSGASHPALPPPEDQENCTAILVRRLLSARVLGLTPIMGIIVGALLASRYLTRASDAPRAATYIPHRWAELLSDPTHFCSYAGLRHAGPMQSIASLIDAIMGADLIVSVSTDGEILNDASKAHRIPTRRRRESRDSKRIDWSVSTSARHDPQYTPPTGSFDPHLHDKARARGRGETLREGFFRRFPNPTVWPANTQPGRKARLVRGFGEIREGTAHRAMHLTALRPSFIVRDFEIRERAPNPLSTLSTHPPTLSHDAIHTRALYRLNNVSDRFRATCV